MHKRKPSQHKGGRLPDGAPAKSKNPKINAGWAVTPKLKQAIAELPQVQKGGWSQSYLVEQVLLALLGEQADYDWSNLNLVAKKQIIE